MEMIIKADQHVWWSLQIYDNQHGKNVRLPAPPNQTQWYCMNRQVPIRSGTGILWESERTGTCRYHSRFAVHNTCLKSMSTSTPLHIARFMHLSMIFYFQSICRADTLIMYRNHALYCSSVIFRGSAMQIPSVNCVMNEKIKKTLSGPGSIPGQCNEFYTKFVTFWRASRPRSNSRTYRRTQPWPLIDVDTDWRL